MSAAMNGCVIVSMPVEWLSIIKNSMQDIIPAFDSNRMADEYYKKLYMV